MIGPLLMSAALAGLHPGPPLYAQVFIEESEVLLQIAGEQKVVNPWLGIEGIHVPPIDPGLQARFQAAAPELIAAGVELAIDGEVVAGELVAVECFAFGPGNDEPNLQIDVRYPCLGTPSEVRLTWGLFCDEGWGVPTPFRCSAERSFYFPTLTREEPSYTWHAPERSLTPGADVEPVAAPGERVRPSRLPILALWAALVAVLLLRTPRARLVAGALGLMLAGGAWRFGSGGLAIAMPDPEQALAIFDKLHQTVYGAFEARTEDELYAILASAVDQDQIDELYSEIHESLVLREEGGAFCTIEEVTPIEHGLVALEPVATRLEDLHFEIDWSWRVAGTVTHFGHSHRRTNVYRALYSVAHDGSGWRIAARELLEHSRSTDGGRMETLTGPEEPMGDEVEDWEEENG